VSSAKGVRRRQTFLLDETSNVIDFEEEDRESRMCALADFVITATEMFERIVTTHLVVQDPFQITRSLD
jgi:hypothetical protein